jgi:hypothetical protein
MATIKKTGRQFGRRPPTGSPERPTTQRTYRIYNDLLDRLPEVAHSRKLTIGEIVNRAIESYLTSSEDKAK